MSSLTYVKGRTLGLIFNTSPPAVRTIPNAKMSTSGLAFTARQSPATPHTGQSISLEAALSVGLPAICPASAGESL
jgi:hypothetical protein